VALSFAGREDVMIALIEDHKEEIAALCRMYDFRRLTLFGSAATGAFEPATSASDLDFVVDPGEYDDTVHLRYLGLIGDLQDLLGSTVDTISDPFLLAAIARDGVILHDAGNRQAAT
jgi:predicted nucleotidyltransferase